MVDLKKVQMMTMLAAFEKKEQDALGIVKYECWDYVRIQLWKLLLSLSVSDAFLMGMVGVWRMDEIMECMTALEFDGMIRGVMCGYIGVLLVGALLGGMTYHRQYRKAKKKVKDYDRLLHFLRRHYRQENNRKRL